MEIGAIVTLPIFLLSILTIIIVALVVYFLEKPWFYIEFKPISNNSILVLESDTSGLAIKMPRSLRMETSKQSITNALYEFCMKLMEKNKYTNEDLKRCLSKICVKFIQPRNGGKAALKDNWYLQRREMLNLGPPTQEDLKIKESEGTYDSKTKTFYANGMTYNQYNCTVTWNYRSIRKSAFLYEVSRTLIWQTRGEGVARAEGTNLVVDIDEIVASLQ